MISRRLRHSLGIFGSSIIFLSLNTLVLAAPSSELTQQILSASLSVDFVDASLNSVASPTVALSTDSVSFDCQTTTGTIGSAAQQLYVVNPDAADAGWDLTVAASSGTTSVWDATGASADYDFNDPNGSGCTDGTDADGLAGALSFDFSSLVITAETGTDDWFMPNVSSETFEEGVTDNITVYSAIGATDDVGSWTFQNIGVSQTIPAKQPADTYNLNLSFTIAAK